MLVLDDIWAKRSLCSDGHAVRDGKCVEIGLHQCDNRWYGSQSWWNLSLWLASVTTARQQLLPVICHVSSELVFWKTVPHHIGHGMLPDINISHGSVACGRICNDVFIANFPLSVVKGFWNSAVIWRRYGQEFGVFFWTTVYNNWDFSKVDNLLRPKGGIEPLRR